RIILARAQVQLGDFLSGGEIYQRNRVIFIVSSEQPAAGGVNGDASNDRAVGPKFPLAHARHTQPGFVLQLDGVAGFGPTAAAFSEDVNVVVYSAGGVKMFAVWRPGQPSVGVGYLQGLALDRRRLGDIENENVFVGLGQDGMAIGVKVAVVSA